MILDLREATLRISAKVPCRINCSSRPTSIGAEEDEA
jgi:hypothetical protein